jgi:hypothetical protein
VHSAYAGLSADTPAAEQTDWASARYVARRCAGVAQAASRETTTDVSKTIFMAALDHGNHEYWIAIIRFPSALIVHSRDD